MKSVIISSRADFSWGKQFNVTLAWRSTRRLGRRRTAVTTMTLGRDAWVQAERL